MKRAHVFAMPLAFAAAALFFSSGSGQEAPPKAPRAAAGATTATTAILDQPSKIDKPIDSISVAELFRKLSDLHGVTFRVDVGYFRERSLSSYNAKVSLPIVKGLSVRDVLQEVIAGLKEENEVAIGIQVKGSQIILGRKFIPPAIPGQHKYGEAPELIISVMDRLEMMYGPTVSLAVEQKSFADVIHQLRESSGANIVVDARIKEKMATPVTITVNDAKLMTVLKLAGDMCDVAPAVVDNVYYITTKENAERLTTQTELNLFGERQTAIPFGFVTDGITLYEKPAGLKPTDKSKVEGIAVPSRVPESVVKPAAPAPVEKK